MSITLNALYYLKAWEAKGDIVDGMAHRDRLQKCNLDYSIASLGRIDAFLDMLRITCKPVREEFLDRPENQNLMYFLAFYAGEAVGRALGAPPLWLSYQDALMLTPSHKDMFSECFETSICCRYPDDKTAEVDFFTPMYALATRLLSPDSGKSIRFSAGLFFPALYESEPMASAPTPALTPGLFGEAFTLPPVETRCQFQMIKPWWGKGHKIQYMLDKSDFLLEQGRAVWGATIQANEALFKPEYCIGACADVVYDSLGRLPPEDLLRIAKTLFSLKGTKPRDASLMAIAEHLNQERDPVFWMDVPDNICPQPLKVSSTYFDQVFLPDGMLTLRYYPLLISDQYPGAIMVLPWQLWPADFTEIWRKTSESIHGKTVDSRDWKKRYDQEIERELENRKDAEQAPKASRLYQEGLLYFHGRGVAQDFDMARQLWEQAAELGETNSLNNLGLIYEQGLGVNADVQQAISYYVRAAGNGHILAQLNMGKTFLRDKHSGIDAEEAKRWLQMAARQGSDEAIKLLLQNFGQQRK